MKRHIPNTITCCNLISGCSATFMAFQGHHEMALALIVLGAVFDFFDGFAARLLHVSSPIGKELDSLADVITFGLAPSAMVFNVVSAGTTCVSDGTSSPCAIASYLPYLAFVMAAFSALRLAKFNLDERQTMGFIGMPTPANALFWSALIVGFSGEIDPRLLLAGTFVASYLLVSEIPMFALKFKNFTWNDNKLRYSFLIAAIVLIAALQVKGIAMSILLYILLSSVTHLLQRKVA